MIGQKVAWASMLMIVMRLTTRLFDLVTMLVLARLLVPTSFGLVAIAGTLVAIVEAAFELPVSQALLQLPTATQRHYDSAFTLSALRGLALATCILLAASPFAAFYGDPRLTLLVCVLSLGPVARGLGSPTITRYQKQLSFWRNFGSELTGKLTGFTIAMAVAAKTHSYWALVVGTTTYPIVTTAASYVFAPYRPRLSLAEWPVFRDFLGWLSAAQIISAFNWQFERLLLGKLQSTSRFGLFATASDLSNIPLLAIFVPILGPLLAAFANVAGDRERLAAAYQKASAAVLLISLPLLAGESLIAVPIVRLLLGAKWQGAAPLLEWLALSLMPGMFAMPAISLFLAVGRTRLVLWRNLIELSVKLPLVLIGATQFGFLGVIAARCVSETAASAYSMVMVRRLVGLSFSQQITVAWRTIISTLVMAIAATAVTHFLPSPDIVFSAAVSTGVTTVAAGSAYAATLLALWLLAGRPAGIEELAIEMLNRLRKNP